MKIGETTQKVQVTEAAPAVQLTSSTLSGEVEAQTVRELPLNGRDWTQLITLSPGAGKIETQDELRHLLPAAVTVASGSRIHDLGRQDDIQ